MRTISAQFAAQLRRGFQIASLVEVWGPAGLIKDSSAFDVAGGQIDVDGSASVHRTLTGLKIVDNTGTLVPQAATDLFSVVSSNELRVYTGMVIPGLALPELLLQGIFGLQGCRVEDSSDGLTITLTAYDRARAVSRAKLTSAQKLPASSPPTTTAITQIVALLAQARPGTQVKLTAPDPGFGIPEMILDEGTDVWEACRAIADGIGWEMFFDWDGQVLMRPVLDPNSTQMTSVWTYAEGVDSTLLRIIRDFDNDEAFNGQVVTGESTANALPARGIAWDTDPASPTYYLGPYGQVPEFWTSETIRSDAQATAAAVARLNQRKGANEQMEFGIVPNHAHVYGDVVTITRAKSKVNSGYIIDKFGMGLGAAAGAMSITTRQRRVA